VGDDAAVKAVLLIFASVMIACPLISCAAYEVYCHSLAAAVVEQWAKREGYRVVRRVRRLFFRGPFAWTMPSSHIIFRVTLEDQDGLRSVAWIDCGNLYWGDTAPPEVQWSPGP
jgi:hypothetical protein